MNDITKEKNPSVDLRIQDLLVAYLRHWRLLVLCVIIASIIAWGVTHFGMTKQYQASATIYVSNSVDDKEGLNSSDLSASLHLVKGYMLLSKSDQVLNKAAEMLGEPYKSGAQLRGYITTSQLNDTVVFAVKASHQNPAEAARIANAVSKAVCEIGPGVMKGTYVSPIDSAQIPGSHYSPDMGNNLLTGAAAGLLVAVAYVTIMFLKDTRIKDENDLTDMFDLPILGRIPNLDDHVSGARYVDPDIEKGGVEE